ncbi:class I SAM-dependent methyltransferase [Pseudenhygromyxa sp. WMMC2535]|uniref:TylF/MycF/NovP-related O-methyltransferase n=1 Tax=Pseudenhygromyxa sp. WMMC2535 TaxID=2712867 RepID=UPI0015549DB3|nr:TylF/MycF/NovP-related O-methyltransferase [Pseudenhygromyxa sp. WMMC2535]NVB43107.1 class I SAM-dependent methyltransferase [Pseudenhygromyxa sp. WMMC2535]
MTSTSLSAHVEPLFRRLSPIRYRSPLRYPRLVGQVLWRKRRDQAVLSAKIQALIAAQGRDLAPEVLDTYLESMLLLHYLQLSNIKVYSMLKPELMDSLASECARVLRAGVPGDFVDVGVWKGGSSMIMKSVNDYLGGTRRISCLDIYDTMDLQVIDAEDPVDDRIIVSALDLAREHFGTEGVRTSIAEIRQNFRELGVGLDGVEFLRGNLISPDFPFDRVGEIALLRIDCDFYTATKNTLARLYPKVQPGGTIIFDDYYLEGFGEARAADEFRAEIGDDSPLLRVGQSAVWRLPGGDQASTSST